MHELHLANTIHLDIGTISPDIRATSPDIKKHVNHYNRRHDQNHSNTAHCNIKCIHDYFVQQQCDAGGNVRGMM